MICWCMLFHMYLYCKCCYIISSRQHMYFPFYILYRDSCLFLLGLGTIRVNACTHSQLTREFESQRPSRHQKSYSKHLNSQKLVQYATSCIINSTDKHIPRYLFELFFLSDATNPPTLSSLFSFLAFFFPPSSSTPS